MVRATLLLLVSLMSLPAFPPHAAASQMQLAQRSDDVPPDPGKQPLRQKPRDIFQGSGSGYVIVFLLFVTLLYVLIGRLRR